MCNSKNDFVTGNLKKPKWADYLAATEDDLMERLNSGSFAHSAESWSAEKEIIALAMAEKSRRRARWFNGGMMAIAMLSAVAAWIAAYKKRGLTPMALP